MAGLLSHIGPMHQFKMAFFDCQRLEQHRRALARPKYRSESRFVLALSTATRIGDLSAARYQQAGGELTTLRKKRKTIRLDGFRPAVGLCIVNNDGLVFAARRVDDKEGTWQMPQGGIDCPEDHLEAAMRELKEETGIVSAKIVHVARDWFKYEFPTEVRSMLTGRMLQYRGQSQMWHLIHFYGNDREIDLEHHGEREFSDYTWMPLDRLPDEVVAFKRQVYRQVAQEFLPVIEARRRDDGTFKAWELPYHAQGVSDQRGSVVPFFQRRSTFMIERSRILPVLDQPLGPGQF
eukprot:jgi/Botrbrau1/12897/Bobra.0299s0014.1